MIRKVHREIVEIVQELGVTDIVLKQGGKHVLLSGKLQGRNISLTLSSQLRRGYSLRQLKCQVLRFNGGPR